MGLIAFELLLPFGEFSGNDFLIINLLFEEGDSLFELLFVGQSLTCVEGEERGFVF